MEKVSFRAHARIKDIVGKDLINNDNIAIIELIKNAKDAGSKKVYIIFENSNDVLNGKIIIQDFGKGMSGDDIKEKWLNIAYSEKRDSKGRYAGDKGVGRFSCDRLGKTLNMYSIIEKEKTGHKLHIDWTKFEIDDVDEEVGSIKVDYSKINRSDVLDLYGGEKPISGTTLVISNLRAMWNIQSLKQLKKALEKFVIEPNDSSAKGDFYVYLQINNPCKNDKEKKAIIDLTGLIENKIFENLNLRTTSIDSSISDNGKIITTTLHHDGNDVFTLKEKNHYTKLAGIRIQLYYLNQPSKVFFKINSGYRSVDFGSVFMFRNGFRVFPYGEPDNDWLKLNKRKAQGQKRHIGTRELVGKIIINDKKNAFSPVSAREGLVENEAFKQLTQFPIHNNAGYFFLVFRKLEKFVVDGLNWFNLPDMKDTEIESIGQEKLKFENRNKQILDILYTVLTTYTNKKDIIDIELNENYILSLAKKEKNAFAAMRNELLELLPDGIEIDNFLMEKKFENLKKVITTQNKQVKSLQDENITLKTVITTKNQEIENKNRELKASDEINMFLRSLATQDSKNLENLMHKIALDVLAINERIYNFRNKIKSNNYSKNDIEDFLNKIHKNLQYISKITEFAINRNYRIATGEKNINIIKYIKDYLINMEENKLYENILLNIDIPNNISKTIKIKPLDLSIMIDNIISNSKKARASKVSTIIRKKGKYITIDFIDNGNGITSDTLIHRVFEKGYSTTEGSGLGLYFLKDFVVSQLFGKVDADSSTSGFIIRISIPCN